MLDYPALQALAAVVREGSFERAARALHVTPSAVSQRVKGLEERVGAALVVRGQPCRPTALGQRLCRHLDEVRLLEADLPGALPGAEARAAVGERPRVPLPVAVNADSLATWAAAPLARYAADQPVLLQVTVMDEHRTAEALQRGEVLAAVTARQAPVTGCSVLPLGAMRYRAAASPAFVARHFADGVHAANLRRAPALNFGGDDDLQARWARRTCRRAIALPQHVLPSTQAFLVAAQLSMGWGLHPEALVAPALQRGELVELIPDTPLDVPLVWQCARAASALLSGLGAALRQAAQGRLLPLR